MTAPETPRHALIFGASGLIGRHLILTLAESGAKVTAAVRTVESGARVQRWLGTHGLTRAVDIALVDFDAPEILPGGAAAFADVTEIHNCAGSFRFGMPAEEARSANVGIVEKLIDFAAELRHLQRLVHISGYRVGGQDPAAVPWSDEHRAAVYAKLGGYEASKVESDAIFQARCIERGIPWTVVNPATVIGDSLTGESDQHIGIATTIEQMWQGTATALPAGDSTFVPVLTVDYLAAFMAAAAVDPDAVSRSYWVLDDATPPLAEPRPNRRPSPSSPRIDIRRSPPSPLRRGTASRCPMCGSRSNDGSTTWPRIASAPPRPQIAGSSTEAECARLSSEHRDRAG